MTTRIGILAAFAFTALAQATEPGISGLQTKIDSLESALIRLQEQVARAQDQRIAQLGGPAPLESFPSAGDSARSPGVRSPGQESATQADIDGLRTDLENYKYEQQRSRETKTALVTRGTTIGGSVQARASAVSPGTTLATSAVASNRGSSYDVPSASINFAGSLYRDYTEGRNLDFRVQLAYARNAPANDNSLFNLADAYVRYNVLSTAGLEEPRLNVTFGQQQTPFGLEAQTGEELRPVINSAQFLAGTSLGRRNVGLVVRGDLFPYVDFGFNYRAPLFEYAAGIVTGSGPNKSDDNDAKDWIVRGAFTLPVDYHSFLREFKVGGSYYQGAKNITRTTGTGAGAVTTIADNEAKQVRFGGDVYYNHDPFGVTYEYVRGLDENWVAAPAPAGKKEITGEGHVATAFFTFGNQWVRGFRAKAKYDDWWPQSYQFFARFDQWDPNIEADANNVKVYTAGFNWFFAETSKFQVNYNLYDYQDPARERAKELLAQVQFGF